MTWSGLQVEIGNAGFGETATVWAHWPSGQTDFSGGSATDEGEGLPVPAEETLVRSIISCKVDAPVQGVLPGALLCTACFGFLTWDATTVSAGDIDVTLNPSGVVPNPARDWSADWVMRIPMTFTSDNFFAAPVDRIFIESKAMRKLPPRTGLLAVFGFENILAGPEESVTLTWQLDARFLWKSGYYSNNA